MNGKPTAAQKRFHDWCRDWGCLVTALSNPSIHHIKGAKMKLKGVKGYAGEWYVIPLIWRWHQDTSNPAAIHTSKSSFECETNANEKEHWVALMSMYKEDCGKYPMSEEEYQIIADRA